MSKLLVVDDDTAFARMVEGFLVKQGYDVDSKFNIKDASRALDAKRYDLVLVDFRLPDGDGLDMLAKIRNTPSPAPAIVMTSFNDVRTAVKCVKFGASNYITKPINPDELLMVIREALPDSGSSEPARRPEFLTGTGEASKQLHQHIELVAPTEMSVVLMGESGTGKENVSRTIHELSKRKGKPFIPIDCGAISRELSESMLFGHVRGAFTGAEQSRKGAFENANGGTLFLDEIGNLTPDLQTKLLRVLQEKVVQPLGSDQLVKVDVRIICATHEDLATMVRNRDFREDLYHRLNEFMIKVPPLRERAEDLTAFIHHFMERANEELDREVKRFAPEVMTILQQYDWPGNLRELKNVVRRAVLLTKGIEVGLNALPDEMLHPMQDRTARQIAGDLRTTQEAIEKEMIVNALKEARYNKSKAARKLNIDRKTLYQKMVKYNIEL